MTKNDNSKITLTESVLFTVVVVVSLSIAALPPFFVLLTLQFHSPHHWVINFLAVVSFSTIWVYSTVNLIDRVVIHR